YSSNQINVYVRDGADSAFSIFLAGHPEVSTERLKAPTRFLAHSERMWQARRALDRFLDDKAITFHNPSIPVVASHTPQPLPTAEQLREAVLALADEQMDSRGTVETIHKLGPDMVVELGLGGKSLQLLADNNLDIPAVTHTGSAADTEQVIRA